MKWRNRGLCSHEDANSGPSVFQPVASRYTDFAIAVPKSNSRKGERKSERKAEGNSVRFEVFTAVTI
jgi:hypothetical protein